MARSVLVLMEGMSFCDTLLCPRRLLSTDYHSLIQFYPNFEDQLRDSLRHLVGKKVEEAVEIGMAKDGSGVGGESIYLSPLQGTILKPFISCFGCPHRHTNSFDLMCESRTAKYDLPRTDHFVRIQKQALSKSVMCSVFSPLPLLLVSSIYIDIFDLFCDSPLR